MKRLALLAALILTALLITGPAFAVTNGISVDHSKGVVLLGSPSGAANCKAATTGAIRYNSTTTGIERCNGTAWSPVGLYSQTMNSVPTSASTGLSTWVNQSTATVTDASNGIQLSEPTAAGGNNANLRCKTAPSTPYSVIGLVAYQASMAGATWGGLAWRNSTNGKLEIVSIFNDGSGYYTSGYEYSSPTAWSSTPVSKPGAPITWFKLKNDGTTTTYYFSNDGAAWISLWSAALAGSYLGSTGYNQICFLLDASTTGGTIVTLLSYKETSP